MTMASLLTKIRLFLTPKRYDPEIVKLFENIVQYELKTIATL